MKGASSSVVLRFCATNSAINLNPPRSINCFNLAEIKLSPSVEQINVLRIGEVEQIAEVDH